MGSSSALQIAYIVGEEVVCDHLMSGSETMPFTVHNKKRKAKGSDKYMYKYIIKG